MDFRDTTSATLMNFERLPLNTEPGAIATGCDHSTPKRTAINDELSLGPVAIAHGSVIEGAIKQHRAKQPTETTIPDFC